MLDLQRQQEFILEKGYNQFKNADYIYDYDIEYIAENWKLSDELENIVGSSGRKSYPLEMDSSVVDRDKARDLRSHEIEVVYSFRAFFNHSVSQAATEVEDENVRQELIAKLDGRFTTLSVFGIELTNTKGKTTFSVNSAADINGEVVEQQVRKSALKTADRLIRDILTKDYYNHVVKTPTFQEMWKTFTENLEAFQTLASRDVFQKGTLFLSALPEDILTASDNAYNWSSCYQEGGAYETNPYHYIRMENVLIAYFIADNARNKTFEIAGKEVSNKSWRVFAFLTADGNLSFSGQQYPFTSDTAMLEVADVIMSDIGGTLDVNRRVEPSGSAIYDDGSNLLIRLTDNESRWEQISLDGMVCPITGYETSDNPDNIKTFRDFRELDVVRCHECGEYTHEDDRLTITPFKNEEEEWVYCECCAGDLVYNESMDDYIAGVDETVRLVFRLNEEPYPIFESKHVFFDNQPEFSLLNLHINLGGYYNSRLVVQEAYIEQGYDMEDFSYCDLEGLTEHLFDIAKITVEDNKN